MKLVNIFEAKTQLSELLDAAAGGERVVICKRNQPIAELRPLKATRTTERPLGLARGRVTIEPSFFEPLPEDVLESFEAPGSEPEPAERASRVAERRAPYRAAARRRGSRSKRP